MALSLAAQAFARRWRPRPLLPPGDARDASLFLAIAILCFFACLAALAGLAADRAARGWSAELRGSATVLVRPGPGQTADAAAARVAETLAGVRGVSEARALEKAQITALLQPWLGLQTLPDDLPLPRLVALQLDSAAPPKTADLERALKAQGLDATVDDHSLWLRDIVAAGVWARAAAILVFVLAALAASATIQSAARAALVARLAIVEVLCVAGARDGYIAGLMLRRFAGMAFLAATLGAAGAAAIGAGARLIGGAQGLTPALPTDWIDLLALAPCPVLAAVIGALCARAEALRLLRRMA
jgi:cell division transport system permease protein